MSQLNGYERLIADTGENSINLFDYFSKYVGLKDLSKYKLESTNLILHRVDKTTYQNLTHEVNKKLSTNIKPSGKDYHKKWEDGWEDNLIEFCKTKNLKSLYPYYIKKNKYFRFSNNYFTSDNDYFEVDFAKLMINYFFEKYFVNSKSIVDLGSGSNHYVIDLSLKNNKKLFFALDWSKNSGRIIEEANKILSTKITYFNFDMFEPDQNKFKPDKSTSVYTIGSLEQLGKSYDKILSWFLKNDFDYIMNVEPIYEFYDLKNPYDLVAARYIQKRNWLKGYFNSLLNLEKKGDIQIFEKLRSFGSLYHETYNFIIWRKNK